MFSGMLNQRLGVACYLYVYDVLQDLFLHGHLAYGKDVVIRSWHTTRKPVATPPRLNTLRCFHTRLFCFKIIQNYQTRWYNLTF
jgi:hypothetical protein